MKISRPFRVGVRPFRAKHPCKQNARVGGGRQLGAGTFRSRTPDGLMEPRKRLERAAHKRLPRADDH